MNSTSYLQMFNGKCILIVEDEYFLADETRRQLVKLNAKVVGPAAYVEDALELISTRKIDGAILDVHLGEELVFQVAERLDELDIPFVFAIGDDPKVVPEKFSGFTLCEKPTELGEIARALFADSGLDQMQLGRSSKLT